MSFDKPSQKPPQAAAETESKTATIPPDVKASLDARMGLGGPMKYSGSDLEKLFMDDPALYSAVREYLGKSRSRDAADTLELFDQSIHRNLQRQVRSFLSDVVNEEYHLVGKQDEEEEKISSARENARKVLSEILALKEGERSEALRNIRKKIAYYNEVRTDPNDTYGEHHDLIPEPYQGMSGSELEGLLKMLPENAAIIKEASDILQMTNDEASDELELGGG